MPDAPCTFASSCGSQIAEVVRVEEERFRETLARGMKEFESVALMMVNVLTLTYGVPEAEAHTYVKEAVTLSLPATKEYVAGTLTLNAIAASMSIRAGKEFVPGEVRNADSEAFSLLVMAS